MHVTTAAASSERHGAELVAGGFARAMIAGDAAAAASYFAEAGRLLTADRTEVSGVAIESVLAQVAGSQLRLEILLGRVVTAGKVALATQYWKRSGSSDRERFQVANTATLVLAQDVSRWSILIASPWG